MNGGPYNEPDTRAKLVDEMLHERGWTEDLIRREQFPGKVLKIDGKSKRDLRRIDYVLNIIDESSSGLVPVAMVEAKAEKHRASRGLQQVKDYAETATRFDVRFVYSTNGRRFVEFDRATGKTSDELSVDEFPPPGELKRRLEQVDSTRDGSEFQLPPASSNLGGPEQLRYYQYAAIRCTLRAVAQGENRVLLSLATGTGKTHIAVKLLRWFLDAGQLNRALFLCDRDVLRTQAWNALQSEFGNLAAIAERDNPQKNARVIIATYQTLGVSRADSALSYLRSHYPEGFFTHIVIDECHRSAWGKWSDVLERFGDAVQIGMTATPTRYSTENDNDEAKQDQNVTRDNLQYFGDPVYEYTMAQGIEDGFLAFISIQRYDTRIAGRPETELERGLKRDDLKQATVRKVPTDEPVDYLELRETYKPASLEVDIVLPPRTSEMSRALFEAMTSEGRPPEQKTIVFCVSVDHAIMVASELNNQYADWRKSKGLDLPQGEFAFACTSEVGREKLADFQGLNMQNFVATTVDLLTTGVDIPWVENIVFFRYVNSPILVRQIVGRGTRIDEDAGKLACQVLDFTDATRHMHEDIPLLEFPSPELATPSTESGARTIFEATGVKVETATAGHMVTLWNDNGTFEQITLDQYEQRVAVSTSAECPDYDDFVGVWAVPTARRSLILRLPGAGILVPQLGAIRGLADCDEFDVLAKLVYDRYPLTKVDRVARFIERNGQWLEKMQQDARNVLLAIAKQFEVGGTNTFEDRSLFEINSVKEFGGFGALSRDGFAPPDAILSEFKRRFFQ